MNLQKKLIQLSEYKCSFKYVDSYFVVSVVYPQSWSVIPSEDRSIEVAEEDGVTFYVAPIETDIEAAFTLIDDTISYNLDVEKKMALLKYNIGKLQELFAEKDLEELETIEFIFKATKKTAPRKTVKKVVRKPRTKTKATKKDIPNDVFTEDDLEGEFTNKQYDAYDEYATDFEEREPLEVADVKPVENKYVEEVER